MTHSVGGLQPGSAQTFPRGGEGGNVLLNMAIVLGGLQPESAQIFPGGGEGDRLLGLLTGMNINILGIKICLLTPFGIIPVRTFHSCYMISWSL